MTEHRLTEYHFADGHTVQAAQQLVTPMGRYTVGDARVWSSR